MKSTTTSDVDVNKTPEHLFTFEPSEGEPFTMTGTEVADVMAFVRELKAKADKESVQYPCNKCDGECEISVYPTIPVAYPCKSCDGYWTP